MYLARHLEQLAPASSEASYERLTSYAFARRYAAGKAVADVCWEMDSGSLLIAQVAESVAGLTNSAEPATHPAPNASYRPADLPELSCADGSFDLVVAFGVVENLERPEDLLREAKRVLKRGGVLLVSVPDRRTPRTAGGRGGDHPGGMHALEFHELLEGHFGHVRLYRQGAVVGGLLLPVPERAGGLVGALVESFGLSLTDPRPGALAPETRSLLAVCAEEAGTLGPEEGRPYVLLDRRRRVFDECEDLAEDVELLQDEIRRMQETEVQAFRNALKLCRSEITYLRAQLEHLRRIESSTVWRLLGSYRRLRYKIGAPRKSAAKSAEEGSTH